MRRYSWALMIVLVILTIAAIAQTKSKLMNETTRDWEKVDSLINIGKPESAKKIVAEILQKAQNNNTQDEIIKAKAWILALDRQQEDASVKTLQNLETEIINAGHPVEKAIWQNLAAKTYWD